MGRGMRRREKEREDEGEGGGAEVGKKEGRKEGNRTSSNNELECVGVNSSWIVWQILGLWWVGLREIQPSNSMV
jgi:hypothetical protein